MLKSMTLAICTLMFTLPVFAQAEGPPLNRARMPIDAQKVADFVPSGWQIEAQVSGDLNADRLPDIAVKLIQVKSVETDDQIKNRHRALLLLFKRKEGGLHRAALAEHLLQCTACGGAFYGVTEAPAEVSIVKGILIVNQDHGSRHVADHLYRFRYEAKFGQFMLIGYDLGERDRATGESTSESSNYLTGKKIISRSKYDPKRDQIIDQGTQTLKIPRTLQAIETVSYEDR